MSNLQELRPAEQRQHRQKMLDLLEHHGQGAVTDIGVEKECTLHIDGAKCPAILYVIYQPEKNTFSAKSMNAYLEHVISQSWPSASAFAHDVAGDLYDHGLPYALTLHLDIEHDGMVESFEVRHNQPGPPAIEN